MILIAPDKFKGTLSAQEVAQIISEEFPVGSCLKTPMADGGEGTASIVGKNLHWEVRNGYYVDKYTRTAIIDSSQVIGLDENADKRDILRASSAPLGLQVREIINGGCKQVIIGVGGTGCCDGGLGFLMGLGLDHYRTYHDKLLGLCDVEVPLTPGPNYQDNRLLDTPSALTFAPQKGAKDIDLPVLYRRLLDVQREYGHGRTSPFDGAGGGLGFAIASAIGAPCVSGAKFVLEQYNVRWDQIDLVITGEGCIDEQTAKGKVASVVAQAAKKHDIPCIAIGGTIKSDENLDGMFSQMVSTDQYYADEPLTKETAIKRLRQATKSLKQHLKL